MHFTYQDFKGKSDQIVYILLQMGSRGSTLNVEIWPDILKFSVIIMI